MKTAAVAVLLKKLDGQRAELKALRDEYSVLSLNGTQEYVVVSTSKSSRRIALTFMSRETGWQSTLVRGKEMILLGIKKSYAAMIDESLAEIALTKSQIAEAVKGSAA